MAYSKKTKTIAKAKSGKQILPKKQTAPGNISGYFIKKPNPNVETSTVSGNQSPTANQQSSTQRGQGFQRITESLKNLFSRNPEVIKAKAYKKMARTGNYPPPGSNISIEKKGGSISKKAKSLSKKRK